MKIYTKTGDDGNTGLLGGSRISKSDSRIIAYGSVDELNSNLGLVISFLSKDKSNLFNDLTNILIQIQNHLFVVGSDLADPNNLSSVNVKQEMIDYLEHVIDEYEKTLSPIKFFILPGGSIESSYFHICRCIARRSESKIVSLSMDKKEDINPLIKIYLNRLSDFLFVISRIVNSRLGISDIEWKS